MILHLGWLLLYTKPGLFVLFSEPSAARRSSGATRPALCLDLGAKWIIFRWSVEVVV